jgi:hypothetical protein
LYLEVGNVACYKDVFDPRDLPEQKHRLLICYREAEGRTEKEEGCGRELVKLCVIFDRGL